MTHLPDPLDSRTADHAIEDFILKRWSPRAMNGEPLSQEIVNRLFEAARWAPSSYNEQEWRFLYAHRDSKHWPAFLELLMEANQSWCVQAGLLIVVNSRTTYTRNGKPNNVHILDTGMALQNLLLQATALGLVCHPMGGFDRGKSKVSLEIPDGFEPHCMVAVGHPGRIEQLPKDFQDKETPSGRKPIAQTAQEGKFQFME